MRCCIFKLDECDCCGACKYDENDYDEGNHEDYEYDEEPRCKFCGELYSQCDCTI